MQVKFAAREDAKLGESGEALWAAKTEIARCEPDIGSAGDSTLRTAASHTRSTLPHQRSRFHSTTWTIRVKEVRIPVPLQL